MVPRSAKGRRSRIEVGNGDGLISMLLKLAEKRRASQARHLTERGVAKPDREIHRHVKYVVYDIYIQKYQGLCVYSTPPSFPGDTAIFYYERPYSPYL